MTSLDEHYLRVRDYAARFSLSESAVYKKIDRGEIKAIRIGKAVRIPSSEMDRYLHPTQTFEERGAPRDSEPGDLGERAGRFEHETGHSPAEYVQAWRSGEIDDTPENARSVIEALALRDVLERSSLAVIDSIDQPD